VAGWATKGHHIELPVKTKRQLTDGDSVDWPPWK